MAVFGVSLSLTTLVMERTREIGIFRAIGASQGQVRVFYLVEAGLLGLFSSVIGVICGLGMAMILTWVVNKAFFGWTIQFRLPWLELLATPFWVTPIAVLAGFIPAAGAARFRLEPGGDIIVGVMDEITDYTAGERIRIGAKVEAGDPVGLDNFSPVHRHLELADGEYAFIRGDQTGNGRFEVNEDGGDLLLVYDASGGGDALFLQGAVVLQGITDADAVFVC